VEFVVHQVVMEQIFLLFSANILPRVHSIHFYLHAAFIRRTERRDMGNLELNNVLVRNVDVQKEIYIQLLMEL